MKPYRAPAERLDGQLLLSQIKSIDASHAMETILQAVPDLLLVVNAGRQVVALNKVSINSLCLFEPEKALGSLFGEVLGCKYALQAPDGCGTTPCCSSCGADIAVMSAIDNEQSCERICALTTEKYGQTDETCLLVRSRPIMLDGNRLVLVYARDVSKEQLAFNVETDFMRNMSAMLNAAKSYGAFVQYVSPDNELLQQLNEMTDRALQEIRIQSLLKHQSSSDPHVSFKTTSLARIRTLVFSIVLNRETKIGKMIEENEFDQDVTVSTDPVLAARVITNMLQNALDASDSGDSIRLHTLVATDRVTWQVWNRTPIAESIQPRIFQRYFTTKEDHGSGQGTHLMKLLGEKCLGGQVSFVSTLAEGTTFSFSLPRQ